MKIYYTAIVHFLLLSSSQGWKPRFSRRRHDFEDTRCSPGSSFLDEETTLPFCDVPPLAAATTTSDDVIEMIRRIVLYKPPVGIVCVYLTLSLIWSGRLFQRYASLDPANAQDVLDASERKLRNRRRRRWGRTAHLELDDIKYDTMGGIDPVRRKLCESVLWGKQYELPNDERIAHALAAIRVVYDGKGARVLYVKEIVNQLLELEELHDSRRSSKAGEEMVTLAYHVAEIRALDSLLRITRDRLLRTCARLGRLEKYWSTRVYGASRGPVSVFSRTKNLESTRGRLALAQGAYRDEIQRLGKVQSILASRPADMSEHELIEALTLSENSGCDRPEATGNTSWFSKVTLRFNLEGKGKLTLRYLSQCTEISSEAAQTVLGQGETEQYTKAAQVWIQQARQSLAEVVEGAVKNDLSTTRVKNQVGKVNAWVNASPSTKEQWQTVIAVVDSLRQYQRVGEGTLLSIRDSRLWRWLDEVNVYGIPSSLTIVCLSSVLHDIVVPYWGIIQASTKNAIDITWNIVGTRIWQPIKDIVVDLISKDSKSFLDLFDIENEINSLDIMLRDLGFGDGTPSSRTAAMQLATRRYEHDLQDGFVTSVIRGRMTRLLLLQVQQLKAGLLNALESIDSLVASNRLNVQLLAAVPAVLGIFFGFRFFLQSLFAIRIKTLRSLRDVHAEMAGCLDEMFKLQIHHRQHNEQDLGEFVLQVYTFLVLLDYSSPLISKRSCDDIHRSIQELMTTNVSNNMELTARVELMRLLKEKHASLLKQ